MVRNFIDIVGISNEGEINKLNPDKNTIISKTHEIFTVEKIRTIFQIILNMEIKSKKELLIYKNNIYIVDCNLNLKLIYTENEINNASIMEISLPFNIHYSNIDRKEISNIEIFIIDGYFDLIGDNHIYCEILYCINIYYGKRKIDPPIQNYNKDQNNSYKGSEIDSLKESYISNYDDQYL